MSEDYFISKQGSYYKQVNLFVALRHSMRTLGPNYAGLHGSIQFFLKNYLASKKKELTSKYLENQQHRNIEEWVLRWHMMI